jgi:DNA-binding Lrp family transcriptional regulator
MHKPSSPTAKSDATTTATTPATTKTRSRGKGVINNKNNNNKNNKSNNDLGIDYIDIKIIKELLTRPDIQSSALAKKLGKPLSTIQRRKTRLQKSLILKPNYELSIQSLGWRNAEILMLVDKGKADFIAEELIEKFENVIGTSIRINTEFNLAAYVGYKDSSELHELMEKIRAMPNMNHIQWSEVVREVGNKNHRLAHLIFNSAS